MFTPGATIWHNYDDVAVPAKRALRNLTRLHSAIPDAGWKDVSVHSIASGFVWQAIIIGTAPGGPVRAHTCMVARLSSSGLIERLDEYIDPAAMAPLQGTAKDGFR
jgi:hypothetical protein